MSREIKFRAWVEEGKWDYYAYDIQKRADMAEWFGHSNIHIEQYTGLTDKNGKEIYEGDIVSIHNKSHKNEYDIGVIEFKKGAFRCPFLLGKYQSGQVEVIGNIHENPELLGGKG